MRTKSYSTRFQYEDDTDEEIMMILDGIEAEGRDSGQWLREAARSKISMENEALSNAKDVFLLPDQDVSPIGQLVNKRFAEMDPEDINQWIMAAIQMRAAIEFNAPAYFISRFHEATMIDPTESGAERESEKEIILSPEKSESTQLYAATIQGDNPAEHPESQEASHAVVQDNGSQTSLGSLVSGDAMASEVDASMKVKGSDVSAPGISVGGLEGRGYIHEEDSGGGFKTPPVRPEDEFEVYRRALPGLLLLEGMERG